jgi:hypothetical protein
MEALQYDAGFLVPRVLTNLLYVVVAAVGLAPLERIVLCHHSHRAAEEHTGRNLDEILAGNIDRTIRANAGRLEGAPAASQT